MQKRIMRPAQLIFALLFVFSVSVRAETETAQFKKQEGGFYKDLFEQNVYDEGTDYLHLERLYRGISHHRLRAGNVNAYDEVPDSTFFTNRHGRRALSESDLEKGYQEAGGPDLSGNLTVMNSRFDDVLPTFFVSDAKGDKYLLKFDPADSPELATSSEVIASRFYYAIGYHVPQYTIVTFDPAKLIPGEGALIVDDTGFTKKFTRDKLEEYLLFLPQDPAGRYRASASKVLAGENKGFFSLMGRRKCDPEDKFDHKDLRELRALRVFSAWLNNYDIRESNTLDMLVTENGQARLPARQARLKHYLIDFNAALGSGTEESKPPMVTHEHLIDYGETAKSFFTLGFLEKTWQRRWREVGEKIPQSPAVGYFDNRYFDPGKFKNQLPHYLFKDLTRADGFWAAKIVMSFSDDDIRAMVKAGKLTNPADADYIAKTLIERRDMIGRYWFLAADSLDEFELSGNDEIL